MRRTIRATGARLLCLLLVGVLAVPVAAATPSPSTNLVAVPLAAVSRAWRKEPGKLIKRGTVDVGDLASRPATAGPHKDLPRLTYPTPAASPGAPAQPQVIAPAPALPGPAPAMATTTTRPPIVTTPFDGLAQGTAATNFEPPDPWVAVGPDHVVQVVNTAIRIFDRQGTVLATMSLHDFFGLPINPVTFNADPRVIYDSLQGRWVVTELSFDCAPGGPGIGTGYLDIAISDTADPLRTWTQNALAFAGEIPDYPAAGTSTDKVAIASNVFGLVSDGAGSCQPNGADYRGAEIDVFEWDDLGVTTDVSRNISPAHFTVRPALQAPATTATIHAVAMVGSVEGEVHADYLTIRGSVSPIDSIEFTSSDLTATNKIGAFGDPPPPQQPSGTPLVPDTIERAVDGRPTDALWQNGRLVWVSTIGCTPTGDVERDCVRVSEIDTTSIQPRQDFVIGQFGKDIFHGGIGLSLNGALHVTYTRSAVDEAPGTHAVYQLPGDATNAVSPDELVRGGTGPYTLGERWGDYTGIAQDPQDPNVVWQTNEVSNGGWATHVSPLSTAVGTTFVPITPQRVLDTRPATTVGLVNKFAHGVARTWQVAGVGAIPAEAVAVTGNVTVVEQTGAGHVSVTPRPTNAATSSTINVPLGDVRANNLTTPLGPGGTLAAVYVASAGKRAHVLFDVTGYFVAGEGGSDYNTLTPARIVDTRPARSNRLTRNVPRTFQITGNGGVPVGAAAVTGNLTVTQQTHSGHVSLTPTPDANPPTSTLNFPLGDNRANGVTIPLSPAGKLSAVYKASTAGARTHLIFDVTGYYLDGPAGLQYFPLNPGRRMDTRTTVMTGLSGRFQANSSRALDTAAHLAIPPDAAAVTGNLTVTQATRAGHLALTPDPANNPSTSTVNFPAGDTRANGITQRLNASGDISIWFKATSGGTVHAILDVTGYFR
jgi:hypothetical protein